MTVIVYGKITQVDESICIIVESCSPNDHVINAATKNVLQGVHCLTEEYRYDMMRKFITHMKGF